MKTFLVLLSVAIVLAGCTPAALREAVGALSDGVNTLAGKPTMEQEKEMIRRGINPFPPKVIIQQVQPPGPRTCRGRILPGTDIIVMNCN